MEIEKEVLVQTCREMKEKGFDYLKKITAVDYGKHLEVVYIFYDTKTKMQEVLTTELDPKKASIESIIKIYPAADWYERELYEMFGIKITGRGAVSHLLLEEWNGSDFPLLKSFEWGKPYGSSK